MLGFESGVDEFPDALLDRVTRVRPLAVGGEAVVFLVEPDGDWCEGASEAVVKVNKAARVDHHQMRLLSLHRFVRHVPRIFDYGDIEVHGETVGWMAQEYCPHGSLHDVIHGRAAPTGDAEPRQIIAELADCLNFWVVEQGLTHTDVKPANILVRSRDPYELLIGDFGGTARDVRDRSPNGRGPTEQAPNEHAQRGRMAFTLSYASPETLRGRRGAPAAWWALGIIAYELLLGRRPYAGMAPGEVRAMLRDGRRPALTDVDDPDWRRLIEGLLTVDPERRWGYEQVAAWVARTKRPVRFNGRTYRKIEHLVDDLEQNWAPGIDWLAANGGRVADWLVELGASDHEVTYLRGLTPGRAARALGRLTASVLPDVTPRYEGRPISASGLLELARRGDAEQRLLRRALEDGALEYAAGHGCAHSGCQGRCAVLDRVDAEVPEIVDFVAAKVGWLRDRIVRSYRGRAPAELPSEREWTTVWAWATELTLSPEAAVQARALAAGVRSDVPWWLDRRRIAATADPATVEGRGHLVVTLLLARHARRAAAVQ
ncbi:protein kinase-like protein [Actinomadura pelletieri DSM 43383]|uniref:Protein kinase-like protein n=1 Tax=Actinomadura pelletieri DSM 43383 TaxID=1120940 RepID=A0A495QZI7_9ACTN|nr:protein kinase [Actinomadura pelletieri]RKS79631.1 protein kinase-like protein [Actinomadura pelletieri DSM 43383]